jgi:hypothetical protein
MNSTTKKHTILKKLLSPVLAASLLIPATHSMAAAVSAMDDVNQKPGFLAMFTDLLVLRPVGLVATALGSVVYVISIPFNAPTGGMKQAGQTLVVDPATFTFARCLGCTTTGYHRTAEETEARAVKEEEAQRAAAEEAAATIAKDKM